MTRRTFLTLAGSALAAPAAPQWPEWFRRRLAVYLEQHRRPEGAYGWSSDVTAQITPTFAVVGCYHLLGLPVPDAARVASFVPNNYPMPEPRRKDRPLWRIDFEQAQTLVWLNESIESFRALASTWTKPAAFTKTYELGGNPVFQHQAMAVRVRHLLNLSPCQEDTAWREYFLARLRANGTFNTTPAADGSEGHLMNTLWGLLAAECLDLPLPAAPKRSQWVRECQLPSGGFTYQPRAALGALDDIAYTWCALQILEREHSRPAQPERCAAWIESLLTSEGGFQDRPGGEPNPLATFYALDSFRLLGHTPRESTKPAPRAKRYPVPEGARVFSFQEQAPGEGSPREAVLLASSLGIHVWATKNSPPGWIAEAQRVADAEHAPVLFTIGNEEYGTYVAVPGLGCYSHLVDTMVPYGADSGEQLPRKQYPYPWPEFRDTRIAALHRGRGRMVWQFNENEEITRVLLDEAIQRGTYSGISTFHFGYENFLFSQPFLQRWYGRIPFIGLQDAHGKESWWFSTYLSGFTTLFLARQATWDGWLEALDKNLVMSVRHDAITNWKTELAGGSPAMRDFVMKREREWRWWDDTGKQARRPVAALILLRPGMLFEVAAPEQGLALRLRLWAENVNMGIPKEPRTELVELRVDGKRVQPVPHESREDRYFLYSFNDAPGAHQAEADVRILESGRLVTVSASWQGGQA